MIFKILPVPEKSPVDDETAGAPIPKPNPGLLVCGCPKLNDGAPPVLVPPNPKVGAGGFVCVAPNPNAGAAEVGCVVPNPKDGTVVVMLVCVEPNPKVGAEFCGVPKEKD